MLSINNLHVAVNGQEVLKGIDLVVKPSEVHAIMGPNGAGKTTLAMALMGNPNYKLKVQSSPASLREAGRAKFKVEGIDMFPLLPEERARHGLFVSFQHPIEVSGVSVLSFLRTAYKALRPKESIQISTFKEKVKEALTRVGLEETFMQRSLNEGFSGGEKKRAEVAQLLILRPKFAVLDEIDSGLDIDSLKVIARAIVEGVQKNAMGVLLITHYPRMLHYLRPSAVHVLVDGQIKKSDGMALVRKIERNGYAAI